MSKTWLCVAALAMAAGLAPAMARAADDWPQLQHDPGRTGYTDASVPFNPKVTGDAQMVFEPAWTWEKPAEVSPLVQPVVSDGLAYVGDYDGVLYAIDAQTGQTAWRYKTGGLIYHTACVFGDKVFTGSQDGQLHAVAAKTGQRAWTFATGRGIVSAPCALDGRVFVTSKDGRCYGLEADTGKLLWQFPAQDQPALAPILCSPSAGGGIVTFGDESMTAYGLDAATGQLKWKTPLRGQSFMYYWPVVGAKTGIVVFRTQPVYSFHANLNKFDQLLEQNTGLKREQHDKARAADPDWAEHHRDNVRKEQDLLRKYITEHPQDQTCFVLDLASGSPKYVPPVPYTGGGGYTPAPPVLDDATGRGWMIFRSGYSMSNGGYMVRGYTDVGEWDPKTGYIRQIAKSKQGWETWHLIGDETILLSVNKDLLFLCSWPYHGALNLTTWDSHNVTQDDRAHGGHEREKIWATNMGSAAGNGGGHGESTIVTAEGKIFWNAARYIRANKARADGAK